MSTFDSGPQVEQNTQPASVMPYASKLTGVAVAEARGGRFVRPMLATGGLHLVLTGMALLMILPFTWMVLTSLKTPGEVASDNWIPAKFQWHNYVDVYDEENPDVNQRGINFERFYA